MGNEGLAIVFLPRAFQPDGNAFNAQKLTAQLIQQLGLGIAIEETAMTASALKEALPRVAQEPCFE